MTFCSHNSRPITCNGLSKDRCAELLGSLLNYIHENFRACTGPENFLVRADANRKLSDNTGEQKVILVGAGNLKHSAPFFDVEGLLFVDATKPGWIASTNNVRVEEVEDGAADTVAFVF
jgi:hypothetical protein